MLNLVDDFSNIIADLKVHKRTAANIKEQLSIITRSYNHDDSETMTVLCSTFTDELRELHPLSRLLPLQSYLRQGEISDVLDSLIEACWVYTQANDDGFLREDIETQRELCKTDREADRINLKRFLRDAVRRSDVQQQLSRLTTQEISALRSAIDMELRSFVDQGADSSAARLYREFLSRLGIETAVDDSSTVILDLTEKIARISRTGVAWGAICGVWRAELYGKRVALQSPSRYSSLNPMYNEAKILKSASTWSSFDHPHVLPLLGFCKNLDGRRIALVTPWMDNENVEIFVRIHPGANRMRLIMEVASGLAYLHNRSPPYVHGILTGAGILINDEEHAVIGGFASATFNRDVIPSPRWLAPEFTSDSSNQPSTTASDVYSFAMTAFQIITGDRPFDGAYNPWNIIEKVHKGERPPHPGRKLIHHGLDDRLWSLICRCWAQYPKARPTMNEVLKELESMQELPALDVQDLTSLIVLGEYGSDVRACGAFGDIRVGVLKDKGPVALKTLNIRGSAQPILRHTKRFYREATIWNNLRHPNVLPFLGTADPNGISTCLVSPWMENGNLIDFTKSRPNESTLHIMKGIVRGLAYLHAHEPNAVIHGDLRAANVLISDAGEPLLCDFGLAVIVEDLAQMPISSVLQDAGNPRWMAPELFVGDMQISTASDIWAFGMVLLEITSLDVPYCEIKSSAQVIVEVHKGRLPCRPMGDDAVRRGLSDEVWALMTRCWVQEVDARPRAGDVLRAIESLGGTSHLMHA